MKEYLYAVLLTDVSWWWIGLGWPVFLAAAAALAESWSWFKGKMVG